jgi:hypothetical protein
MKRIAAAVVVFVWCFSGIAQAQPKGAAADAYQDLLRPVVMAARGTFRTSRSAAASSTRRSSNGWTTSIAPAISGALIYTAAENSAAPQAMSISIRNVGPAFIRKTEGAEMRFETSRRSGAVLSYVAVFGNRAGTQKATTANGRLQIP